MTCSRHYTPVVIADLQQIAASIEAERRRQYRAEMAQELREALHQRRALYKALPVTNFDYVAGVCNGLTVAVLAVDELSAPVMCDSSE